MIESNQDGECQNRQSASDAVTAPRTQAGFPKLAVRRGAEYKKRCRPEMGLHLGNEIQRLLKELKAGDLRI